LTLPCQRDGRLREGCCVFPGWPSLSPTCFSAVLHRTQSLFMPTASTQGSPCTCLAFNPDGCQQPPPPHIFPGASVQYLRPVGPAITCMGSCPWVFAVGSSPSFGPTSGPNTQHYNVVGHHWNTYVVASALGQRPHADKLLLCSQGMQPCLWLHRTLHLV
jgi:hypothetical protein